MRRWIRAVERQRKVSHDGQSNYTKIPKNESAEVGGGGVEDRRAARSFASEDHCAGRTVHPHEEPAKSWKYNSDADCDAARIFADAGERARCDCRRRHGSSDRLDGARRSREAGAVAEAIDGAGGNRKNGGLKKASGELSSAAPHPKIIAAG